MIRFRLQNLKYHILDNILPPRCPVSGQIVDQDATLSPDAWESLRFVTDPMCESCGVPFPHFEQATGLKCPDCLKTPPRFDTARTVLAYDDASRRLILSFKHGDQHQCAKIMSALMARCVKDTKDYDVVIPVPMHRRRLIFRRFNQSALLAFEIGKRLSLTYRPDLLIRTRPTPPQKDKNKTERRKNVFRAFAPSDHSSELKGMKVLLVDDVYTTGATVNECANVLKSVGARKVDVLTFARTFRQ